MKTQANFSELIGKTIIRIKKDHNVSLTFWCSDESKYKINSFENCAFDINYGNLANLYNEKIEDIISLKIISKSFELIFKINNSYCCNIFWKTSNINFTKLK